MHPMGPSVSFTSAPNGQRHNRPILKVCNATGMPMIVMAKAKLPVKYPMAASNPPKSHHNKFPIIRILILFKYIGLAFAGEGQSATGGFLYLEGTLGSAPVRDGEEVFDGDEVGDKL